MRKNFLLNLCCIFIFFNSNAQSTTSSTPKNTDQFSTKIISENNFTIFRSKENRIEFNNLDFKSKVYKIGAEHGELVQRDGAYYLTPMTEGREVFVEITDTLTGKLILKQKFTIIDYPAPKLLVNGRTKLNLEDKECKLSLKDVLTNKVLKIHKVRLSFIGEKEKIISFEGDVFSEEAILELKKLHTGQYIGIALQYEREGGFITFTSNLIL